MFIYLYEIKLRYLLIIFTKLACQLKTQGEATEYGKFPNTLGISETINPTNKM